MKYLALIGAMAVVALVGGCATPTTYRSYDLNVPHYGYSSLLGTVSTGSAAPGGNLQLKLGDIVEATASETFNADVARYATYSVSENREDGSADPNYFYSNKYRTNQVLAKAHQDLMEQVSLEWDSYLVLTSFVESSTTGGSTTIKATVRARPVKVIDLNAE